MGLADRLNGIVRRLPAWPIYAGGAAWAAWLFWLGLSGRLGPEPVNVLEREYGLTALQLLMAGLAITPLRRWAGLNLLKYRRAVGLTAFFFVAAHLSVWALLDLRSLEAIWADVVKRPYITVGFAAFILLLPLALTSNNWSVRRLGPRWRLLHRLTYPAVILGGVHFLWLVKGFPWEPLAYLAAIGLLLAVRMRWSWRRPAPRAA